MISISPHGSLHFDQTPDSASFFEVLFKAADAGNGGILLALGTRLLNEPLPPTGVFWREFARRYFTKLRHLPAEANLTKIPAPEEELQSLADAAPPMRGVEYLNPAVLTRLWHEFDGFIFENINKSKKTAHEWLKAQNPLWNLVGRVTLHLAENKRDARRPFAFMATYTHRISDHAKPQYLPLGRALEEYAGARNRQALLSLLEPVQKASEKSGFLRELVESQRIYHPQAWSARQAHGFLKDVAVFEESGLLVRMPAWGGGKKPARPEVKVSIGAGKPAGIGLDAMLNFDVGVSLHGVALTEQEWEQIVNCREGLIAIRGQWVEVDHEKIQSALAHWKKVEALRRTEGISFAEAFRLLAGASLGMESSAMEDVREWSGIHAGDWLQGVLARLREPACSQESAEPPPGLHATLRAYQRDGVQWLRFLSELGLGACLADDMGLGKTVQMLGTLLHWRKESPAAAPALLILPASLLGNWVVEADKFAPSLRMFPAHPSMMTKDRFAAFSKNPEPLLTDADVVLTTYAMTLKYPWLREREWSFLILDEAQAIKNPTARQTRAVKDIRARHRIALTGTPVENNLGDLWSIFDFLNPGLLGSAKEFQGYARRLAADQQHADFGPLRRLVRPYILRRLKSDKRIIADLPDKTEIPRFCPLSKQQAKLYQQSVIELREKLETVDAMQRRGLVLAFLMRFKQICNHPSQWLGDGQYLPEASGKFQQLANLVAEIAARQEKMLIFTQFKEMISPLQHFLTGIFQRPGLVLHGGTAVKERQSLVRDFQCEDGPPFFILSLKAGGSGLTLTEASHVIHFDRWWNPAVENQATDRAYRIGQKRNVLVHKFVCRGTIEEKIDRMIEDKKSLSEELLAGGGEIPLTEMKDEELLKFVSLDVHAALQETE